MDAFGIKKTEMNLFDGDVEGFIGWEEGAYWTRVMERLIHKVSTQTKGMHGKTFLEVGCGRSVYMPIAQRNGMFTIGLDLSKEFLKLNKQQVICADAENLPFEDDSIDYLLCVGVIHHVPHKEKMAKELARIAKGKLLILETHSMSLNWIYWVIRKTLIKIWGWERVKAFIGFGTPYESFISKGLIMKFMNSKFNLKCEYYSPFREPPIPFIRKRFDFGKLNDILERIPLIRKFGTYIVFECEYVGSND